MSSQKIKVERVKSKRQYNLIDQDVQAPWGAIQTTNIWRDCISDKTSLCLGVDPAEIRKIPETVMYFEPSKGSCPFGKEEKVSRFILQKPKFPFTTICVCLSVDICKCSSTIINREQYCQLV